MLIAHVSLEPLGRLAAINRRPPAPIDLAQDVLGRHVAVLDLDVLEHLLGEAELPGEHIHRVVVVLRFEGVHRAGAGMGEPGTIAAYQHLAKVQHEVSDIGRHHGSGRSIRQRNLHERVLHRHCRDTEHTRGDREYCVGVSPRARHDANGEEGNKKEQLQQQQRPRRRNPVRSRPPASKRVRKRISMKTGTDRM